MIIFAACACGAPHYASLRERAAAEGMCNDAPAQYLLGREASTETAAAALRATGARYFEWIEPNSIVTAAFSPWRVRVTFDEARRISEVRCG